MIGRKIEEENWRKERKRKAGEKVKHQIAIIGVWYHRYSIGLRLIELKRK